MKINSFLTLIALVLSVLMGSWVFSVADKDSHAVLAGIFSTICFAIPLILALGVSYSTSVSIVNIRVLSLAFFLIMLASHFYYAANGISMPYYVIVNGSIICIYAAIVYSIVKSKQ